jgi:hypothetical protein
MKKILTGILVLLVTLTINAKNENKASKSDSQIAGTFAVAGSVADSNSGELLVGVEVKIEGTNQKTYTDFDGKFRFNNLKPGEYKVVTNYISYKKNEEVLKVTEKSEEVKLTLHASN